MIKRTAVLIFLLVYLCTTVGFALNLHFCGVQISQIRINHSLKKPCCAKETNSNTDKCCKDKQVKIKVSEEQQTIHSAKIPQVINLDLFILPGTTLTSNTNTLTSVSKLSYRGPPVKSEIPLTIQNCVFRI